MSLLQCHQNNRRIEQAVLTDLSLICFKILGSVVDNTCNKILHNNSLFKTEYALLRLSSLFTFENNINMVDKYGDQCVMSILDPFLIASTFSFNKTII